MADTDPEDEGDDVDAPEDRRLIAGDAQTDVGLIGESQGSDTDAGHGEEQGDQPGPVKALRDSHDVDIGL